MLSIAEPVQIVTPTESEKSEWSRMARAAYHDGKNAIGHRYSMAATLRIGEPMRLSVFDSLQEGYRNWLVFDWTD